MVRPPSATARHLARRTGSRHGCVAECERPADLATTPALCAPLVAMLPPFTLAVAFDPPIRHATERPTWQARALRGDRRTCVDRSHRAGVVASRHDAAAGCLDAAGGRGRRSGGRHTACSNPRIVEHDAPRAHRCRADGVVAARRHRAVGHGNQRTGHEEAAVSPIRHQPGPPVPDVVTKLSPVRAITPPAFDVVVVCAPIASAPLFLRGPPVSLISPPAASNAPASAPLVVTEVRSTSMDVAVGSVELA